MKAKDYAKAIMAGAVALVGGIATGYTDDSLTKGELWVAIAGGVSAAAATWGVRNGPKPPADSL